MEWAGGNKFVGVEDQESKRLAFCELTWQENGCQVGCWVPGFEGGENPLKDDFEHKWGQSDLSWFPVSGRVCLERVRGSDWGRNLRKVPKKLLT